MKHAIASVLLFAFLAGTSQADDTGSQHKMPMDHSAMMARDLPSETGQSAFAAIAEIGAKLEADPKTDWSKVNIEALRQHLIDMEDVTLHSSVAATTIDGGAVFQISSDAPEVVASIKRMVSAHVATMSGAQGWTMTASEKSNGVELVVKGEAAKIQALGFIGIMTQGMHHQAHHWAIASGNNPHSPLVSIIYCRSEAGLH